MKKTMWLSSILLISIVCGGYVAAQPQAKEGLPPSGDPALGMGYREVLKLWGAPADKRELEAKREDLWLYQTRSVRFRNGKVVEIEQAGIDLPQSPPVSAVNKVAADARADNASSAGTSAAVIEDILTEIMKGAPADKDGAAGAARTLPPARQFPVQPSFIEQPQMIPEDEHQRAW